MAAMRGDVETMEPLIDAAERVATGARTSRSSRPPAAGQPARQRPSGDRAAAQLHRATARRRRGTPRRTRAGAAPLGDGELMLDFGRPGFLAVAEWLRGRLAEGRAGVRGRASTDGGRPASSPRRRGAILSSPGSSARKAASTRPPNLPAGARVHRRARHGRSPRPAPPSSGSPRWPTSATTSTRRWRHVTEGIALCRQFVHTPPLAAGLVTLAWIRQATGDPAGAGDAIDRGRGSSRRARPACSTRSRRSAPGCCWPRATLTPRRAGRGDCGLAGRRACLPPRGGVSRAGHGSCSPRADPAVRARYWTGCMPRRPPAPHRQPHRGRCAARTRAGAGGERAAVERTRQGAAARSPAGHVRVFADEGGPMAALLGRLDRRRTRRPCRRRVPLGYLARTCSVHVAKPRPAAATAAGMVDPLTTRELEVLAADGRGHSNPAIAAHSWSASTPSKSTSATS